MDKLKYIKLENEDGSYSSSIPLAVDSDNVDVNGSTLTNIIETKADVDEVDASLSILNSKIDSVTSGSPAGVYDTVAALTAANPDHSKIYLVSADGHWYYYNNSIWADGGVYQAVVDTDLKDGSEIAWDILSQYEESYTPNVMKGSSYNINTGAVVSNKANRARTDRISIANRGDIVILDSDIYEMDIFYYSAYYEEFVDCFIFSPGVWSNRCWASKIGTHYTLAFRRKDDANITSEDVTAIQAALHFYRFTDQNLTIKNAPADAKIVGDKFNTFNSKIGSVVSGIDSQYSIEDSDFIVGSYYGSNSGFIQTDSTGVYARLPKQWLNGITALKINTDYVMRAVYYGESGTFLNKYSGDYACYVQIDLDNTIKQIGINVRRLDSTPLSSTDITNIAGSLKFLMTADKTLSIKNAPAESVTVEAEKVSNDTFIVTSDLYDESTYSYSGINYTSPMWHHGYLANDGAGYAGGFLYVTLTHGLDYVKGSTPSAVKVKIKDASNLSYPYIRIGWYDNTANVILATVKGEQEIIVPVPTYPNAANTTGGLVITVGRFSSDAQTLEEMQYRANEWADENVEITCLYEPVYKDRGKSHPLRGSHENDYLYNSEFQYALKLPQNYTAYTEQKTPLIILCHGLSSTLDENMWGSSVDMIKLVKIFTSQGYAVMDVQRVTSADWCNPALVRKYKKAIDYIVKHYNVEVKYVYAESMGCLISLALQQTYDIKAMVITGIRLDFEDRYSRLTGDSKTIVDTNLGLTNGWDKNIVAMYCPTLCEVLDSDGEKVNYKTFPPTLYIEGTEDTQNETSEIKIKAIQRGGSIAKLSSYPGDHHTVCYLLGPGMAEEALAWFDDYK